MSKPRAALAASVAVLGCSPTPTRVIATPVVGPAALHEPTKCEVAGERLKLARAEVEAGRLIRAGIALEVALEMCPDVEGGKALDASNDAELAPPFGADLRGVVASVDPARDVTLAARAYLFGYGDDASRIALGVALADSPLRAEGFITAARAAEIAKDEPRAQRMWARAFVTAFGKGQERTLFFPREDAFTQATIASGPFVAWPSCKGTGATRDGKLYVERAGDETFVRTIPGRVLFDRQRQASYVDFVCYTSGGRFRLVVTHPGVNLHQAVIKLDEIGVRSVMLTVPRALDFSALPDGTLLLDDGRAYFGSLQVESSGTWWSDGWYVADADHPRPSRLPLPKWVSIFFPTATGGLLALQNGKLSRFDGWTGKLLGSATLEDDSDGPMTAATADGAHVAISGDPNRIDVFSASGKKERVLARPPGRDAPLLTEATLTGDPSAPTLDAKVFGEVASVGLTSSHQVVMYDRKGDASVLDLADPHSGVARLVLPRDSYVAALSARHTFAASVDTAGVTIFAATDHGGPRIVYKHEAHRIDLEGKLDSPVVEFVEGSDVAVVRHGPDAAPTYFAVDAATGAEVPVPPGATRGHLAPPRTPPSRVPNAADKCDHRSVKPWGDVYQWCGDDLWLVRDDPTAAPTKLHHIKGRNPPRFGMLYDEKYDVVIGKWGTDVMFVGFEPGGHSSELMLRWNAAHDGGVVAEQRGFFSYFGAVQPAFRSSLTCGDARMPIEVCAARFEVQDLLSRFLRGDRSYR